MHSVKNILKNQIKVLLAIVLLFGVPGFIPPQNSMQTAKLSVSATKAPHTPPEPVAVKVLPASPLGFLQKTYEVQKTEDVFALQQSGGYAVQASLFHESYQLGEVFGVFSKEVVTEFAALENLQVSPLQIVAKDLAKSPSGSFFESFSFRTGAVVQEKGLVQALSFAFRLKTSSVPSIISGAKPDQGGSRNTETAAGEERFVFRC